MALKIEVIKKNSVTGFTAKANDGKTFCVFAGCKEQHELAMKTLKQYIEDYNERLN